ncbi:MAG: transcriptional repressor [Omnitrophica bacterium]|nr:transcriptional repressor [Candidatus Omnitrophota bacterium]
MHKESEILERYIKSKDLRHTPQREKILNIFLSTEKHLSADELHKLVKKRDSDIGYTTVYRAIKLFSKCGLLSEVDFGDGIMRFEHKYGHGHHDHLVCTKCGKFIEVIKPRIEKLQESLAKEHGFKPTRHKLQIFGTCRRCSMKK